MLLFVFLSSSCYFFDLPNAHKKPLVILSYPNRPFQIANIIRVKIQFFPIKCCLIRNSIIKWVFAITFAKSCPLLAWSRCDKKIRLEIIYGFVFHLFKWFVMLHGMIFIGILNFKQCALSHFRRTTITVPKHAVDKHNKLITHYRMHVQCAP